MAPKKRPASAKKSAAKKAAAAKKRVAAKKPSSKPAKSYVTVANRSYGKALRGTRIWGEGRRPSSLKDDGRINLGKNILEILAARFPRFRWIITKDVDSITVERGVVKVRTSQKLLSRMGGEQRLYFKKSINAISSLKPRDPFGQTWVDPTGRVAARSEAWGRNPTHDEQESIDARRLICSSEFLKDVLVKRRSDLLVLVVLRRYDKGSGSRDSEYCHTTAVVRTGQDLDFEFFPGAINQPHVMEY